MAVFKSFHALRFSSQKAEELPALTCPPYDIISEEERQAFLHQNPNNIIRLELPKGENPYGQAGQTLSDWLREGILETDPRSAYYIYEEEFAISGVVRRVKGVIGLVRLEEFSKGIVLPHEETLSKAKTDRLNLMQATGCNFSQIYSLYMDEDRRAGEILERASAGTPEIVFTDTFGAGVTHRLWALDDPEQTRVLEEAFADKKLYIADGHHRYETALNYRDELAREGRLVQVPGANYVMMLLVDMAHPGLVVFPTHRLLRNLAAFNPEELLNRCGEFFTVRPLGTAGEISPSLDKLYRQGEHAFVFYAGAGRPFLLTLKDQQAAARLLEGKSAAYCGLDVTVLHTLILERLLGIDRENMAGQRNLSYTRSMDEALAKVESGEFQCCFLLSPTRVTEIRDVAAAGEKMPQKSTYFYPKLITGLVMNRLSSFPGNEK